MSVRPGLFAVNRSGGSGTTEVHALIGQENFSNFSIHEATGLHPTGAEWSFTTCDLDDDLFPDLAAINRNGGSGTTEVHVLSGASKFKKFILQTATGLHPTGLQWDFAFTDWNGDGRLDLVAINRQGGSGKTEVHVLSGASGWKDFIAHIETGLHSTDFNWSFQIAYWNSSGRPDLVAINRQGGSGSTEIHVLSGESNLQNFILHKATGLHPTGIEWRFGVADWDNNGQLDLIGVNPKGSSGTTEVHILSAASGFKTFILHTVTGLHHTDQQWELLIPSEFIHLQIDQVVSSPAIKPSHRHELLEFAFVSSGSPSAYHPAYLNRRHIEFAVKHPFEAGRAFVAARDANGRAERDFPTSTLNGEGDAMRHCYWSARLHRDLDSSTADEILENHEFGHDDPHDRHNNEVGKEIGSNAGDASNDEVWGQCRDAAVEGSLEFD
jgi:FG-GAP-like repeat